MKLARRHTLSARLLVLFLLTALAIGLIVRSGFEFTFSGGFRDLFGPHLGEYVAHLTESLGNPPSLERAHALVARLPLEIQVIGPAVNFATTTDLPALDPDALRERRLPDGTVLLTARGERRFIIRREQNGFTYTFFSERRPGRTPSPWWPFAGLITLGAALAVLALAYHLIGRLFRPVETIRAGVARFGAGDFTTRIDVRRRDELGTLARDVNHMADELERMLEAKRQLLLAISHELRSPLTRAKVNLALLPDSTGATALQADLDAMEAMIAELLESERLNTGHVALNRGAVDPSELIQEVIDTQFATAAIATRLQSRGQYLALDAARIKLLVRNLLANAIRHTPAGAQPPAIESLVADGAWQLGVADQGPGIAQEHLQHLTEPFYRVDAARARDTGGVGLGLYLCRKIVEAHGGRIRFESAPGRGLSVRISIPL